MRFSAAAPSPRARAAALDLGAFVTASPSSFHAAREAARRLAAAGFTELSETAAWSGEDVAGDRYVLRDGSLIAWSAPDGADTASPFRIVGSHTDSPGLKVKPDPRLGAEGLSQVGVEIYGGPLLNSWLDRELRLAGRLALADGTTVLVDTPGLLRVPQLAVHLDRAVNKDGLVLDPQRHMQPILGFAGADVLEILAHHAGVRRADIVGLDVVTVDAQAPALSGADEEFLASGRLDNLTSVHAEVEALLAVAAGERRATADGPRPDLAPGRQRPRGGRLRDPLGSGRPVPRGRAGAGPCRARRRRGLPPPGPRLLARALGRRRPRRPPELSRAARPRHPTPARRGADAEDQRAAALCDRCRGHRRLRRRVREGRGAAPALRLAQRHALRLHDRTAHRDPPGDDHHRHVGITLLSMHSAREMCATADPLLLQQACTAFLRG
jgi:aspartyl aminopeptidase